MLNSLNYTKKNKLLLPMAALGIVLCWFFAFSKTFEAIALNQELRQQTALSQDLSFNSQHAQQKLATLKKILKSYRVDEQEWSNTLWIQASSIAMKQKVGIDYVMAKSDLEVDSTVLGKNETLNCYGNYTQLVKLIDTLEKVPHIGKISGLRIRAPKEDATAERSTQCAASIQFTGLNN
jgi:hypothetical protein